MAKYKYIPCDIYKRGIYVFVGDIPEFGKWMLETFNEDEDEKSFAEFVVDWIKKGQCGAASFHYSNITGQGVLLIPSIPELPKDIAMLSHECLHATFFIMNYCGVEYDCNGSNESFTYLTEHLVRNALEQEGYEKVKTKGGNK